MNVEENKVVTINYTVRNEKGEVIDTSENAEPLNYIHGTGSVIPGLEEAMSGRNQGDAFSVEVEPEAGYGQYNEELVFTVGKDRFQQGVDGLEVGSQVQAQTADGGVQVLTVREVGDEEVTLDANHPLAGEKLHFDIKVEEVRDAEDEEIEHGHVH
jgi:FKBP-type peptidyl-prolyl cis-trans isomerase SlyD